MTKSAQQFITPLLVTSLNGKKCYTELFSVEDESKMNHIYLARKPDVILISPATANIIAKLACGIADDLASTILLATTHISNDNLKNISIIVTAGPTIENIDPVRFVSNKSSGKQGFAIASELAKRGAIVTLITGPVNIPLPNVNKIVHITSAEEMFDKTMSALPATVIICAAAVADWKLTPEFKNSSKTSLKNKIKKSTNPLIFKTRPKLVIGFAAETENIISYAKDKLISKKIDLILANDVSEDKVFGKNNNKVFLIDKNNCEEWDEQDKKAIAFKLADKINNILSI